MHLDLSPLDSVDQTHWFIDSLSDDFTVDGLVPPGFDAYARILHPAADEDGRPVRWAEVAESQGTTLHPVADFGRIARGRRNGGWAGDDPAEGSLDRETLEALVTVLGRHTTTPGTVWLDLWDGWGQLPDAWSRSPRVQQGSSFRTYFLFRCALDDIADLSARFENIGWELPGGPQAAGQVSAGFAGDDEDAWQPPPRHPDEHDHDLQSPQQWWPDDRAWAVATEIDDSHTIVAGSVELIEAVVTHPVLEAFRIGPQDSLSDTVNPQAAP